MFLSQIALIKKKGKEIKTSTIITADKIELTIGDRNKCLNLLEKLPEFAEKFPNFVKGKTFNLTEFPISCSTLFDSINQVVNYIELPLFGEKNNFQIFYQFIIFQK